MSLSIFRHWMVSGGRALGVWSLALIAVISLYLPIYPSMKSDSFTQLVKSLPPALVDTFGYDKVTTGAGYAQAAVFGLLGFVIIVIAAVSWAATVTGGAEESGRLELVLARGVTRTGYLVQSVAAILTRMLVLALVVSLAVLAWNGPADLGLSPSNLAAEVLAWFGLGAICGMTALAVGAISGRRTWAMSGGAAVAAAGYAFHAVAANSKALDWLGKVSPYQWAFGNDPLTNGLDWFGLALLGCVATILAAFAVVALNRRDIS